MTDDQYIIATLADLAAGQSAIVVLHDGKRCLVHDIAWGMDYGDEHHHVTTNVSPSRPGVEIDYFHTSDVASIEIDGRSVYQAG